MWTVSRKGPDVHVRDIKGDIIANVGQSNDYRINKKIKNAQLMSMAPDMLEVLISVQELFKHEYFRDDHPIIGSIYTKCNELISKSMATTESHNAQEHSRDNSSTDQRARAGNVDIFSRDRHSERDRRIYGDWPARKVHWDDGDFGSTATQSGRDGSDEDVAGSDSGVQHRALP